MTPRRSESRTLSLIAASFAASLAACNSKDPSPEIAREIARREEFAHELIVDAGAARAWGMSSRSDVLFEDGFSTLLFDPPDDFRNHAFRWLSATSRARLKTREGRPMRLFMHGWADPTALKTRPEITVYIDGRLLATSRAPEDGLWAINTVVPSEMLRRTWVELRITVSSVAFHWIDAPYLKVATMNGLVWHEEPAP